MKKILLYLIVAIIVIGTGGYFYLKDNSIAETKYRTEKVSRGDVVVQVRATGTINPVQTVRVGSQVSGIISVINVDFNSVVRKGEILAQIDSTFLYASVREAEANVERNQAQINEVKRTLERTKELFGKGLSSQSELDVAQTAYEQAIAQLKQTQAALDRARVNLRYSIIKSPIDGVVISRDVDVGQTVAASLQAPQLFSIANDLSRMQVEASVDEADIGQIQEGQTVGFTVDAYPDDEFKGTVKQVRLAPVVNQNVVTYTIIIEVPNPDLKLRPGMTATVSILVDKREHVLRVPTLALRFQPPANVGEKMNPAMTSENGKKDNSEMRGGEGRTMGQQGRGNWAERKKEGETGQTESKVKFAKLWIPDAKNGLRQITLKLGLNDNRYAEIVDGEIKEGDEIIVGIAMSDVSSMPGQQSNPFGPQQMPRGSGRGMR